MTTTKMRLNQRVWHGRYREKGEPVVRTAPPNGWVDDGIKDDHGCGNYWVLDGDGLLMNVWECEVETYEPKKGEQQ